MDESPIRLAYRMLAEISLITCVTMAHNPHNILLLRRTLYRVGSAKSRLAVHKLLSNTSNREFTKRNVVSAASRVTINSLSSSILRPPTPSIAHRVIGASTHRKPCPNTPPTLIHGDRLHKSKPSRFAKIETSCLSGMVQTRPPPSGMKAIKIRLNLCRRHQMPRYQRRLLRLQHENLTTGKRKGKKAKRRVTPTHESADPVESTEPGGSAEPGESAEAVELITPNNRDQLLEPGQWGQIAGPSRYAEEGLPPQITTPRRSESLCIPGCDSDSIGGT